MRTVRVKREEKTGTKIVVRVAKDLTIMLPDGRDSPYHILD